MIDEDEDYITKSKLTITVKTFSKYNDGNTVASKKINRLNQSISQSINQSVIQSINQSINQSIKNKKINK